ncbi:hypothetical protein ACLNGM_17025 [Aureimonas phyllosphaerae]|uniref:hypothetical protein n=1 Tax=Aureimonas phyllosphaerae TaxID=1166078 RepID=UPI003A5C778E
MLAFELVSNNAVGIPSSLVTYVESVLDQAIRLVNRSESVGPETKPEAISLALEILGDSELFQSLHGTSGHTRITPELASRFLRRMEHADARAG